MKCRLPRWNQHCDDTKLGALVEADACRWLKQQGLRIVARNYHCRFGEIDIIASDRDTLVFVEVRFRRNRKFGTAAESVDVDKQKKICATASHYLQNKAPGNHSACRFDVLAAHRHNRQDFEFDWYQNAFYGFD